MKVTIEVSDVICTIEDKGAEGSFEDLYDILRGAAIGVGFSAITVEDFMPAR